MQFNEKGSCSKCSGAEPEAMRGYIFSLDAVEVAVDNHFGVHVFKCAVCYQKWICVWTEVINWDGGPDCNYRSILPITDSEAQELISSGENVSVARIEELGQDRRWLQCDSIDGNDRILWVIGHLRIGPHG